MTICEGITICWDPASLLNCSWSNILAEMVANQKWHYEENRLLETNFENAKCTYDTNMNRYVNKKKSKGKVDGVVSIINSVYLLQQDILFDDSGFTVQVC